MSRLISPTHVRKFLLETANKTRHRKFERVSKATLDHRPLRPEQGRHPLTLP